MALTAKELKGEVQFPRKKRQAVTFTLKKDHYYAKIPGITKTHRYDLHVNLVVGETKAVADFGIDNLN